jgi:UDP-glucose 4-epimerase
MVEHILEDLAATDDGWNLIPLRYFNPVGAHPSGQIGEDPNDIPNNLMPYISQVAVGKLENLVFLVMTILLSMGRGYAIFHVTDLAQGHVAALNYLQKQVGRDKYSSIGFLPINSRNR